MQNTFQTFKKIKLNLLFFYYSIKQRFSKKSKDEDKDDIFIYDP